MLLVGASDGLSDRSPGTKQLNEENSYSSIEIHLATGDPSSDGVPCPLEEAPEIGGW